MSTVATIARTRHGAPPLGMIASTREGNRMEEQLAATAADDDGTVSPLVRIREKEVEISGQILAARGEAERIVAEARREAVDFVRAATEEADRRAEQRAGEILRDAEAEVESARAEIAKRVEELESRLASRQDQAVQIVFTMVTEA